MYSRDSLTLPKKNDNKDECTEKKMKPKRRSFKTHSSRIPSTILHRADIKILQKYIDHPNATLKELSQQNDIPPSTLRNRLSHIRKCYPLRIRGIINYQRIGLSPILLISNQQTIKAPENPQYQFKALSWKSVFSNMFFLRSKEVLNLDLNHEFSKYLTSNKSENPHLWEICYTERKMNLFNYRLFQGKWVLPWLGIREWLIQTAQQPEIKEFPPPNPHPLLWTAPLQLDEVGFNTLKTLAQNWQTPLRQIAETVKNGISTTIVHRRRNKLIQDKIITPFLDISGFQKLGLALVICRNQNKKHHVSIPLIAQSMLQIAREMPSYTFQVLRNLITGTIEYAIWIDIPWHDMYNLGSIITSVPNANQLEYYGWIQELQTGKHQAQEIPASQLSTQLPNKSRYNFQTGEWKKLRFPILN